jgi:predicted nucleic acid-binding protein
MPASDHYLDTNILLSACLAEPASPRVRAWLETADSNFTTSDWALAEFSSALGVKVRRGELTTRQADGVLRVLEGDLLPALSVVETESHLVTAAGMLLRSWPLGLRTGDAMHLAFCARARGLVLATADRILERAAHATGIAVERIY